MTTSVSSAVLSASAVVLAVLAILYSLWDGDIRAALETKQGAAPLGRQRRAIGFAAFTKALPLALYALFSAVVFLPPVIEVIGEFVHSLTDGTAGLARYDPSKAALALTWTGTLVLAVVVGGNAWRLFVKWRAWRVRPSESTMATGGSDGGH